MFETRQSYLSFRVFITVLAKNFFCKNVHKLTALIRSVFAFPIRYLLTALWLLEGSAVFQRASVLIRL